MEGKLNNYSRNCLTAVSVFDINDKNTKRKKQVNTFFWEACILTTKPDVIRPEPKDLWKKETSRKLQNWRQLWSNANANY